MNKIIIKNLLESKTSTGVRKVIEKAVLESKYRYKPCQSQYWNWVEGDLDKLKKDIDKTANSILNDVYAAAVLDVYGNRKRGGFPLRKINITCLVKDLYEVEINDGDFWLVQYSPVEFYSTGLPVYACLVEFYDNTKETHVEKKFVASEGQGAGDLWIKIKQTWLKDFVKDLAVDQKVESESKIQKIGEIAINVIKNYVVHNLDCADVSAPSDEDFVEGGEFYVDFNQIEDTPINIYGALSNQLYDCESRLVAFFKTKANGEYQELRGIAEFKCDMQDLLNNWDLSEFKKKFAQELQKSNLIEGVYKLLDYYEEHGEIDSMFK